MSKRKAGVNDIIYELDNDDIEISSEDEGKEAKINRLETYPIEIDVLQECKIEENATEVISVNLTEENNCENTSQTNNDIGGKTTPDPSDNKINKNQLTVHSVSPIADETEIKVDSIKKLDMEGSKTTIYNEDIIIDSPASNSDLGVVGCENRIPLVTVRFRDRKLASTYKNKLKAFMLRLIKLHDKESPDSLDSETDLELDIWPEDLNDEEDFEEESEENQDNLFFIDTDPCSNKPDEIPTYKNVSTLISNNEEKEPSPPPVARRSCFNCDGAHQLRDCPLPRNGARIAEKRKQLAPRVGRYHVEDEQKYGHLIPGRISGQLRHALGLKRHELPRHIYRMRLLGYPPGWLEEARISHSGITMFDSTGAAILDPEEEEGEVCEPGSKDKFDIKKILDFPGFNVPASSRYKEESHLLGMPPISEQDSKIAMLQMLAPNAMKAYKRKKLALFPSASNNVSTQEVAEMDLDSGDEVAEFPSVPPLPDEAPPTPPPPPRTPSPEPLPPGISPAPTPTKPEPTHVPLPRDTPLPPDTPLPSDTPLSPDTPLPPAAPLPRDKVESDDETSADDVEVVEVIEVADIPVPEAIVITIDDDRADETSESDTGRDSPSLDDLEQKKKLLLDALQGGDGDDISLNISSPIKPEDDNIDNDNNSVEKAKQDEPMDSLELDNDEKSESNDIKENDQETNKEEVSNDNNLSSDKEDITRDVEDTIKKSVSTPESKAGHVKTTSYGTPVMNVASPYVKLPSDVKFAKDICDVINFENLPNSTGKYKQISNVLKRVKSEVDRIQDS